MLVICRQGGITYPSLVMFRFRLDVQLQGMGSKVHGRWSALLCIPLHCIGSLFVAFALLCVASFQLVLPSFALHCFALLGFALLSVSLLLHCIVLAGFVFPYSCIDWLRLALPLQCSASALSSLFALLRLGCCLGLLRFDFESVVHFLALRSFALRCCALFGFTLLYCVAFVLLCIVFALLVGLIASIAGLPQF